MAKTIAIRASERTIHALEQGRIVALVLRPSSVVRGIKKRVARKRKPRPDLRYGWLRSNVLPRPGSLPARLLLWALKRRETIEPRQVREALGPEFAGARAILSNLAAGGLVRRVSHARYAPTAKAGRVRASLIDTGPYRKDSHRARVLEWARARRRPFGIPDAASLLGISSKSVFVVLKPLLRDDFVERESRGVYKASPV